MPGISVGINDLSMPAMGSTNMKTGELYRFGTHHEREGPPCLPWIFMLSKPCWQS